MARSLAGEYWKAAIRQGDPRRSPRRHGNHYDLTPNGMEVDSLAVDGLEQAVGNYCNAGLRIAPDDTAFFDAINEYFSPSSAIIPAMDVFA
ncbi:hypothetical protein K5E40_03860 [Pseudomonas baetica]|uniref:hypothetical protein n=1 Tax=Pseudomonas baetica TaxID=674054 RepID=UPI001C8C0690|nr:hypothetical protein [Pseudomonas baetica]MBX9404811.1 hypothetical protein [Pseudomonas baetica]